jgi:hypothetical protein
MKKIGRIPTIIGIVFLIFGIAAGVILVNNQQIFRLGASSEASPKNVRLSNISSSSLTISWLTDKETVSFVKWGKSENALDKTEIDEIAENGFVHSTTIRNLQASTSYFFKINAAGTDFDNNGVVWEVKTGPAIQEILSANFISGNVITPTGTPAKNALVYVTVGGSNLLSTVTSQNGNWTISLTSARSSDLTTPAQISAQSSLIEISVNDGPVGVATAQIYPQSARPVPPIILGEVHDFKNLPPSPVNEIPNAQIGVPNIATESSGFTIDTVNATPSSKTVTIDSVDNGEIINTTNPEFFGKGPSGTTLTITVESENPVSDTVKVASTGSWNWSPPTNLPEGSHKVTVRWKDAAGILRTLTKTFVVQASEGPAFVATPSGTPRTTSTPKATSFATPSATKAPIPVSGSLTPTLLLSIMGIGVIAFALLLWQKSEI